MGACCSKVDHNNFEGFTLDEEKEGEVNDNGNDNILIDGDYGARVRLRGSSKHISMFTQQGRKGVNQDAMTVWESFTGEKDMIFCGVFDGHGPSGHKVARHIRDNLPSKLSSSLKNSQINGFKGSEDIDEKNKGNEDADSKEGDDKDNSQNVLFSSWRDHLIKSFKEMDEELGSDSSMDSYCSGTTSVSLLKKGDNLIIANLGDSRAVLCTRGSKNQLVSVQLTVDLKPSIPAEAQRIRNCRGRVFAMDEEPEVFRVWMPDEDCPGLAMARAFGDFCLKDFGLISTPEVSCRKVTNKDEFVVLATDGVWDVLTNNEVVKIVASAKKRSMAARLLVNRAVRAWRCKYPRSRVDDCAVICLFLKDRPLLTKSMSEASRYSTNFSELGLPRYSTRSLRSEDGFTLINAPPANSKDSAASATVGETRSNSEVKKLPRLASVLNRRRPALHFEPVES